MTHSRGVCGSASTRCTLPLTTKSNAMLSSSAWTNCSAVAGGARILQRGAALQRQEWRYHAAFSWESCPIPGLQGWRSRRQREEITEEADRAQLHPGFNGCGAGVVR